MILRSSTCVVLLALAACGDDGGTPAPDAAVAIDAAVDGPGQSGGLATTCTGTCAATHVTVAIAATRVLDLAYFGVNASGTLHVEAYAGAASGCPTMSSPTPDYTLILGGVPAPASTAAITSPGNLLDYQGDLLGGPLGAQASTVMLVPTAYHAGDLLALDATIAFAGGTATGHLYATHCASLDE